MYGREARDLAKILRLIAKNIARVSFYFGAVPRVFYFLSALLRLFMPLLPLLLCLLCYLLYFFIAKKVPHFRGTIFVFN